jgi:FMNH2-dependent dimethyl sulfone monooxygenase
MQTCTWAPTVFAGPQVVSSNPNAQGMPSGPALHRATLRNVERIEALGISHLLVAQRWWGNASDIEGSSLDCLAMTAYFAAVTQSIHLVTAIHPGFFEPSAIAKWASTMDQMSGGRWSINVTSGWNLAEFDMYGIDPLDHDQRYERSKEFIQVLRGAWEHTEFDFSGKFYHTNKLTLEPRPITKLEIFQGGQSPAALDMAAEHVDWMFLNGGHPDKLSAIMAKARKAATAKGRRLRFAVYAAPLCRAQDKDAWDEIDRMIAGQDQDLLAQRRARVSGAQGMWDAQEQDPLQHLDTNEGYCTRLIGSPEIIIDRAQALKEAGVDMLHLDLRDELFVREALPHIQTM